MSARAERKAARVYGGYRAKPSLRLVKAVEDPHVEARLIKAGISETIELEKDRGERFVGTSPYQRLDPLSRLLAEKRITRQQRQAGEMYGSYYRHLYDTRKTRGHWKTYFETKTHDALRINHIRREGLLNNHDQIFICDQICGRDVRPEQLWGPDWRELVIDHLSAALTTLAVFYGLIWPLTDVD